MTDAGVVGAAGHGSCEAEAGAGVDDQAGAGGGLAAGALADAGLPPGAYGILQALREVGAGPADLVLHIPLHGALRDAEHVGHRAGALHLSDQVAHLRTGRRGDGAGERLPHGPLEAGL
ncbi:hypothetical protein JL475_37190 [Streptomyces sp. M2CJ-2]|nr:hypothetical protein [Streptomyces sp. M2CJ-2]